MAGEAELHGPEPVELLQVRYALAAGEPGAELAARRPEIDAVGRQQLHVVVVGRGGEDVEAPFLQEQGSGVALVAADDERAGVLQDPHRSATRRVGKECGST